MEFAYIKTLKGPSLSFSLSSKFTYELLVLIAGVKIFIFKKLYRFIVVVVVFFFNNHKHLKFMLLYFFLFFFKLCLDNFCKIVDGFLKNCTTHARHKILCQKKKN